MSQMTTGYVHLVSFMKYHRFLTRIIRLVPQVVHALLATRRHTAGFWGIRVIQS